MPPLGSVTIWISALKAGDADAAQALWDVYFPRLVTLARHRLLSHPRRLADEEDVALSAFASFCRGVEKNRFPRLSDRDDLWQVLVLLTARKACRVIRHEGRQKRGGGAVRPFSELPAEEDVAKMIGREPTPEFAAQVAEECRQLLTRLGEGELRSVALWKMEGWTNEEIAGRLGCVVRTVERRLGLIRNLLQRGSSS